MPGERALSTPCMFVSIILKAESKKLQPIRVKVTVRLLSLLLYFFNTRGGILLLGAAIFYPLYLRYNSLFSEGQGSKAWIILYLI